MVSDVEKGTREGSAMTDATNQLILLREFFTLDFNSNTIAAPVSGKNDWRIKRSVQEKSRTEFFSVAPELECFTITPKISVLKASSWSLEGLRILVRSLSVSEKNGRWGSQDPFVRHLPGTEDLDQ